MPIENWIKVEETEEIDTDPFEVCEPSFIEYETTQEDLNPVEKQLEIKEEYNERESEFQASIDQYITLVDKTLKEIAELRTELENLKQTNKTKETNEFPLSTIYISFTCK